MKYMLFAWIPVASWAFAPATHTARVATQLQASKANELVPLRRGATVALVTPFDPDTGKVNFNELRTLLQFHVREGTDNLCILGTTGEASTLSMAEREQVLRTAVDTVKGKIPILAGIGTIDPNKIKEQTLQAMDIGCDAGLLVTPYYVKPPQRALIQHATKIADLGLPIVLYNVPGRTGVDFTDVNMAIAATHPNIVGVKDATGKLERLDALKAALIKEGVDVNEFLCYSGDDATTVDFVLRGGDGCISVTANCDPHSMHQMVLAALAGDAEFAHIIDQKLMPLHKNLFCEANPIPAKWAVYRMGLIQSPYCRPPLCQLDPKLESTVETALKAAGLLPMSFTPPATYALVDDNNNSNNAKTNGILLQSAFCYEI